MGSSLLYLQHYANGCRLLHCIDDQPLAAFIDLYQMPHWGDLYRGRIIKLEQNYAWVDIGCHRPALLKRRSLALHEGQYLTVRISREAAISRFEDKGPQVVIDNTYNQSCLDDSIAATASREPTVLYQAPVSWQRYIHNLTYDTEPKPCLFVDNIDLFTIAKQACQRNGLSVKLHQQAFLKNIDLIWDEILDDARGLPEGGYITIEETSVLTVIDVNTSALETGGRTCIISNDQERLRFNSRAAMKIVELMTLRHLAGTVMIDFLRHNNKKIDQQLYEYLKRLLSKHDQTKVLGYTASGLMEIMRPVRGLSLKAKSRLLTL